MRDSNFHFHKKIVWTSNGQFISDKKEFYIILKLLFYDNANIVNLIISLKLLDCVIHFIIMSQSNESPANQNCKFFDRSPF